MHGIIGTRKIAVYIYEIRFSVFINKDFTTFIVSALADIFIPVFNTSNRTASGYHYSLSPIGNICLEKTIWFNLFIWTKHENTVFAYRANCIVKPMRRSVTAVRAAGYCEWSAFEQREVARVIMTVMSKYITGAIAYKCGIRTPVWMNVNLSPGIRAKDHAFRQDFVEYT